MAQFSDEAAKWVVHGCPPSGRENLQIVLTALIDTKIAADLEMRPFWRGQKARRGAEANQWMVDILNDDDHIVASLCFTWLDGKVNGLAILSDAVVHGADR